MRKFLRMGGWVAWLVLCTFTSASQLDWETQGSKEQASDEGKLVPLPSTSWEEADRRQLLSVPFRDVVLVGMLDGSISALDSDTGHNLWSFESGSPLVASSLTPNGNQGEQAIPGVDGSLYVFRENRGSKIERMSITIPELVETSPSLTADGSLIIGSQHVEMYYLDLENGELLQKFSSDDKSVGRLDSSIGGYMDDQKILLLGRQNYNVYSVDQLSGFVRWNVSYSHITHLDVKSTANGVGVVGFLDGKQIADISSVKDAPYFHLNSDNTVHSLDPTTGRTNWIVEFEHPPVAVYSPSAAGLARPSVIGKYAHPKALQRSLAWGMNTPKQQMSTPSKIIMGSVDGQFYALPASHGDSSDIPSSFRDHLGSTQVIQVEESLVNARDSLSCLLGVPDSARAADSGPWARSFSIVPEVFGGELHRLFIYLFGLFNLIMAIYLLRRVGQKRVSATIKTSPITIDPKETHKDTKTIIGEPLTPLSIRTSINAVPPSTILVSNEPSTISSTSTVGSSQATDMKSSQVGQLSFGPGILGYGTAGTVVFEGVFHGRSVAVKRLLKQFYDLAANEKDILILSDENPNLIRLYAMEEDDQFVYLALERCQASLASLMATREGRKMLVGPKGIPTAQCMTIIQDIANGLDALHERGVVHRDVKPHNVLITDNGRAKLSDMGLGRRLVADQSSFYSIGSGGSSGWQAPEQLIIRDGGAARQTKTMDVFSLGCVMYYCLTGGGHPFGNSSYERDVNILNGESFLRPLRDIPEAFHLIRDMLQVNPRRRPLMKKVLSHPFWWSPRKRLQFLVDLSDRIENEDRRDDKSLLWAFEGCSVQATGGNWGARLDPLLISNLGQYRKYNFTSLKDLLRVIRNKHSHFREMPTELKELLSPQPDGFLRYFTSRFPHLLLTIYLFAGNRLSKDTPLSKYFPDHLSEGIPKQIAELNEDDPAIQAIKDESLTMAGNEQDLSFGKNSYESRIPLDADGFIPVKQGAYHDRSHSSLRIRTNSSSNFGHGNGSLNSTRPLPRKAHTGTGWDSVFDIIRENASQQPDAPQVSLKKSPSAPQKGWNEKTESKHSTRYWNGVQVPDGFFSSPSSSSIDNSGSSPTERCENGYSGSSTPAVVQDQHPRGFDALVSDARQRSVVSPSPKSDDDPYKDLQSPVKLSEGIRQYERPDMPIVGWEQSPSNSVHTVLRFPRRPGMQLCDFYMKTGFCKYHDRCKFDHPPDYAIKLNEDGLPMRPGEPVCDFYKSTHACKFGGACKFHHPNMQPIYAGSETNDTPSGRDAD